MRSFRQLVTWAASLSTGLFLAAGFLGACGTGTARAADPMLIVSASSVQAIMDDITYITELAGMADAGKVATMMARPYTAGLNKTRPVGLTVSPQFQPLLFLPVEDLKTTLGVLKDQIGEAQDIGDGVLELTAGPTAVFIKEQDKWAFISQTADGLKDLPAKPEELLGKLPSQYDLAVRAFVQRVPPEYRDFALKTMKTGAEEGLRQKEGESDTEFASRRKMVELQLQQMATLINETEQLTFGTRVDRQANAVQLDMLLNAVPDSKLARQCASMEKAQSRFVPLVKESSAFRMLFASTIDPQDLAEAEGNIENMRQMAMSGIERSKEIPDAETRDMVKEVANGMIDVLLSTVKTGQMDMAMTVKLNPQDVSFALAGYVADPKKIEAMVIKLADKAKEHAGVSPLKMNALEHGGVTFHQMTVDLPESEAEARRVFGSSLAISLGIGKEAVYIGLGERGLTQVKEVIDQQSKPLTPLKRPAQTMFSVAEILQFARAMDDNPILAAVADMAGQVKGQDNVRLIVQPIPTGIGYRMELEQGVIKLIGAAAQAGKPKN